MHSVYETLHNARRKGLFGSKPMWEPYAPASDDVLLQRCRDIGANLPADLGNFLSHFGFGNLNDELSFRREWLAKVQGGPLDGHVIFAQDDRGNFYTANADTGAVHYLDRFTPGFASLAPTFAAFLREAAERQFKVVAWAESLPLAPYPSAA